MRLNTGISMSKLNESGYNQFRRFLVANKGQTITTKLVKNVFQINGGELNVVSPQDVNQTALWASRYENLMLRKKWAQLSFVESIVPTKYRPEKHCQWCASIVFHSYSFDLPWLEYCPIHDVKLAEKCNRCKRYWPKVSSLNSVDCDVCGDNIDGKLLIERDYRKVDILFDILSGHEQLRKHTNNQEFPSANFEMIFNKNAFQYKSINQHSLLTLSVIKSLGLITSNRLEYPDQRRIEYQSFDWIEFELVRTEDRYSLPDSWPTEVMIETENCIMEEIKDLLQKGQNHYLDECKTPRKSCIRCASWRVWRHLCIRHDNNQPNDHAEKWIRYIDYLYPFETHPIIPVLDRVVIMNKGDSKITCYKLALAVQIEIRKQSLRTAFLNILWYVDHFRQLNGHKIRYSRVDLESTMPFYAHPLRACPTSYMMRMTDKKASFYWPKLDLSKCILDLEFFYASNFKLYKRQSIQDVLNRYDV